MDEPVKRKRGRPPGSKNKSNPITPRKKKLKNDGSLDEDTIKENFLYLFIATGCGCKIGANILGSGMWCRHKNMMHLSTIERYSEIEKQTEIKV